MDKIQTTLLLGLMDNKLLLAMKKRGFGAGKYNGVGGKLELGETPEAAMLREAEEEIKIVPTKYYKVGEIEFLEYYKGERINLVFHLFVTTAWLGEPTETDEMKPEWFDVNQIPYDQMFPDDKYWLPYLLDGHRFNAFFDFDEDWNVKAFQIELLDKEAILE